MLGWTTCSTRFPTSSRLSSREWPSQSCSSRLTAKTVRPKNTRMVVKINKRISLFIPFCFFNFFYFSSRLQLGVLFYFIFLFNLSHIYHNLPTWEKLTVFNKTVMLEKYGHLPTPKFFPSAVELNLPSFLTQYDRTRHGRVVWSNPCYAMKHSCCPGQSRYLTPVTPIFLQRKKTRF